MAASKITLSPFLTKPRKVHIPVYLISEKNYKRWLGKQSAVIKKQAHEAGFGAKTGRVLFARDKTGRIEKIYTRVHSPIDLYDTAKCVADIGKLMGEDFLKGSSFEIKSETLQKDEITRAHIGWGLACYRFKTYKKKQSCYPALVIAKGADKARIQAFVESVFIIRDLVNTPANDMGPDELEKSSKILAEQHKAKFSVIKDKDLLKNNFPMIFEVGKASTRRPRLIDICWGNEKHPKVTLVGKGVCFDTGGLDIKPSQYMLTMKKDMGGAAHVLALAYLVMALKLPVRLRVLIPAVENAIAGNAYRPSDVLKSRKNITVEVGNTDAEGRLVLADALTYACEENPDILIDFATLTGAARVALGHDLPALFSNKDKIADSIKKLSSQAEIADPVWPLPLWQGYRKDLDTPVADISSTGKGQAGATIAALFLQEFIDSKIEWIHMDVFSWEQSGKPGRPQGGADSGMRAIFAFLEKRYKETKR